MHKKPERVGCRGKAVRNPDALLFQHTNHFAKRGVLAADLAAIF
jgi:hypothetical protein